MTWAIRARGVACNEGDKTMTARELIDRAERNLRLLGVTPIPPEGDLLMMLDDAQREVARDLDFPRRYVRDVATSAPFNLPAEALQGSLSFAERTSHNCRVRILTVNEANDFFPDWEDNEHEGGRRYRERLVIYDPGNISAPVYPLGFEDGETLRMTYEVEVKRLVLDNPGPGESEQPWNCMFPQYHSLLARLVTFEATQALGNELQTQKAYSYYNKAQDELGRLYSEARPDYILPGVNWLGPDSTPNPNAFVRTEYS